MARGISRRAAARYLIAGSRLAILFCDRGAATPRLRELETRGGFTIEEVLEAAAEGPARPRMQDLFLRVGALPADPSSVPSERIEALLQVLGYEHRREAALIDSAVARGCAAFITQDPDILRRREQLEKLAGMKFLHPFRDDAAIEALAGG